MKLWDFWVINSTGLEFRVDAGRLCVIILLYRYLRIVWVRTSIDTELHKIKKYNKEGIAVWNLMPLL